MGFRFSKSFNLGGGVRLNVSKRGIGASVGVPGFRVGIGPSGSRVTAGIPGTGLSYEKRFSSRSARSSRQYQAEIRRQLREMEKLEQQRRNQLEVEEYENYIEMLKSVHKECTKPINWQKEANTPPPFEPGTMGPEEKLATQRLNEYKPSFLDRLFKKEEEKRKELEVEIAVARSKDHAALEDWKARVELAKQVLAGNPEAYAVVLANENPFDDIAEVRSSLEWMMDSKRVEVILDARSEEVVPLEEKKLNARGGVTRKKMSKSQRYDIYQDFVCSCVLRIAREFFAILPVEEVLVHVQGDFLDTTTGHEKEETILSVLFSREKFSSINFNRIDPSDCISTFPHNMKFLKTKGFQPVKQLDFNS